MYGNDDDFKSATHGGFGLVHAIGKTFSADAEAEGAEARLGRDDPAAGGTQKDPGQKERALRKC